MVTLFLPLIALLCIGALVAVNWILGAPERAEREFGPAASSLNGLDRIRFSIVLLRGSDELNRPANPSGPARTFQIEFGESTASVISRLQDEGLIRDGELFRTYLRYSGLDTTLQAGQFVLSPAFSAIEIARTLQDSTPMHTTFAILAGWRLEEIAAALPSTGLTITPEQFLARASRGRPPGTPLLEVLPPGATLEGFLFPGRYEVERNISVENLIGMLVREFDRQVARELRAGFERQGLSLYEAVTLASIVEREAVQDEEKPLIASVFLNRLSIGMKLDADPTVQYAVGYNEAQKTWWTNPLSRADLQIESPYNTYGQAGLPPGPIANPGLRALRAVAFPAETPYFYFRAACDGSGRHSFSETFEQHQALACP